MAKTLKIATKSQTQSSLQVVSSPGSIRSQIVIALAEMCCFRLAEATENYFELFSARLELENLDYVIAALRKLGEEPRREGDPALPSLGMIIEAIKEVKKQKDDPYSELRELRRKQEEALAENRRIDAEFLRQREEDERKIG